MHLIWKLIKFVNVKCVFAIRSDAKLHSFVKSEHFWNAKDYYSKEKSGADVLTWDPECKNNMHWKLVENINSDNALNWWGQTASGTDFTFWIAHLNK